MTANPRPSAGADYPLRFEPILRDYLWGGRRLAEWGKSLAPGQRVAESWEICDRGQDQSRVRFGSLTGRTLGELVRSDGRALFGRQSDRDWARFPLLLKLLDAQQTLSVQVHPDDAFAARLSPPDLGKTEAWVVLAAEPGARLYAGLRAGCDRRQFEQALHSGQVEECLHVVEPRPGDCLFVPAGLVHAIGAGVVIAEIQQSSDVTFRLFDWNRVDAQGRPRALHLEQGLQATDFTLGPGRLQVPQPLPIDPQRSQTRLETESESRALAPRRERLAECDKFVIDRWTFSGPTALGGDARCHLLLVVSGQMRLAGDPADGPLLAGDTALLPAAAGPATATPQPEAGQEGDRGGTCCVLTFAVP